MTNVDKLFNYMQDYREYRSQCTVNTFQSTVPLQSTVYTAKILRDQPQPPIFSEELNPLALMDEWQGIEPTRTYRSMARN